MQPARRAASNQIRKRRHSLTSLSSIRIGELNRILTARHGEQLPDTIDTRRAIVVIAHHLAALPADPRRSITSWLELRAPWYSIADAKALIADTITKPRRYRAHTLAWIFRLTFADRLALGIKTIGAIDAPPSDRAKWRAERSRQRKAAIRRANGTKPRAQYLAEARKPQPWLKLGMSRRTWYRKGKPNP